MKISVIVPAYNEERLISKTLGQLRLAMSAFSEAGWDSELIVCDNNSTDRTAALARDGQALVVFEPINQIARARNSGAAAASGDWYVFVDADSEPSAALLAEVVEQIRAGRCLAGGSTVKLDADLPAGARTIALWNWLSLRFTLLAGSFIFCEAGAFRELGGFNQELFATEELDLTKRLKRLAREKGKQIIILHQHPLLTSARKFQLYKSREIVWLMIRTLATFGGTLRRRESCNPWYDGRR